MKVRQWIWFVAPIWTAILVLLAVLLPDGGITNPANLVAIGVYTCSLVLIVPLGFLARWLDRDRRDGDTPGGQPNR
jgi:hypothetical protein